MTVSILGCAVNGPGEAREADLGVAAAKGKGLLFRKGVPLRYVPEADIVSELLKRFTLFSLKSRFSIIEFCNI